MRVNPELTKESIKKVLFDTVASQYKVSKEFFNRVWGKVEATGIVDKIIERKAEKILPDLSAYSLEQLEAMVSDDLPKNNLIALEMIKRPNFNRELVNNVYNGLGVSVKMGAKGTYGKGIMLKRALNLQQFYTSSDVSKIMQRMLNIGELARIFDPTCGSGRLFWHMPNQQMLHGIEIESDAYRIAKALYPSAQIIQDNTMLHMYEDTYDYVVANPPFTLFWEDKQRIFKFTGYNNTIVSEVAVIESSIRSLHDGGYLAIIMPTEVWINKFMDKVRFVDWLKETVDCIAKIEMPTHTHEGTVWPVALFIFRKTDSWKSGWASSYEKKKATSNLPVWQFTYKLTSYEEPELDQMIQEFKQTGMWDDITGFADHVSDLHQVPFKIKPMKVKRYSQAEYLKTATIIKSKDKVELDAKIAEIDSFMLPPISLVPNGLHADLKINAIRAVYGTQWSPSRRSYVDLFKEQIASLDGFLDERKKYDELPLIYNLHAYDCIVEHSKGFEDSLAKRKEWIDFQNVPMEIWIDENSDMNWEHLFTDRGYIQQHPKIWAKWQKKFNDLQSDPKYKVHLPLIGYEDNWMKHLFDFQKNDVLRLAMKASAIHAGEMGLGKTRTAIATALLKGFDNNLIVCQTRLINTWMEEFSELGLPAPYLVEYNEDLEDMMNHPFVIVSYETLRGPRDRPKPKSKRVRTNPAKDRTFDYDKPSVLQTETNMLDMMRSMGFSDDISEMIASPVIKIRVRRNPKEKGEQTKAQEQQRKLQTMPLFADNFTEKFGYMVVDEAHNLSNPTTLQTQAVWRLKPKHLLFMTGTPIRNRVKGLLSLLIIGWGEGTTAMPYTKQEFLEHFMQKISVEYEVADAHGYVSKKEKEVEIPQIANPDDLRTLMSGKWLRRTKYEPDVASDRKFPKPHVNFVTLEPSIQEKRYAKQWYDELLRLKQEIAEAKEQLKGLRDARKSGYGWDDEKSDELSELEKELRTKVAIFVIMIGKLRAVALAPQLNWLGEQTTDDISEEEHRTTLRTVIHIAEKYKAGITPRQQHILDELKRRVKLGEQCYTIVDFPAFNRNLMKPWLDKAGIRAELIDGGVSKTRRNEIIRKFRDKKVDVILATIGTFDVGINLPSANYCAIIMPTWNWSDAEQTYSRMIRPQSKGERTVDIFILKNTIEDYVRQLMEMKRFNQEYVIDYGPRPPDQEWFKWTDAVEAMFVDMDRGDFVV